MSYIKRKITKIKKYFFPTAYDKKLKADTLNQVNFFAQFIKKGDLVIDIGANMGFKTNVFLKLGAKVVSVEPQQACTLALKQRFGNKITLIEKGVGATNGEVDFYISNNHEMSSFKQNWLSDFDPKRFENSKVDKVIKMQLTTLDDLIRDNGNPSFIKIDVEGFEEEVFKGLNVSFKILSFEFALPENLNGLLNCLMLLNQKYNSLSFNYAVYNKTTLELNTWLSFDEIFALVKTDKFIESFAGDIYVKNPN
jgi:FkbM family methyltransferase